MYTLNVKRKVSSQKLEPSPGKAERIGLEKDFDSRVDSGEEQHRREEVASAEGRGTSVGWDQNAGDTERGHMTSAATRLGAQKAPVPGLRFCCHHLDKWSCTFILYWAPQITQPRRGVHQETLKAGEMHCGQPSTLGASGTQSVHPPKAPPLVVTPTGLLPSTPGSKAALIDCLDPHTHLLLWGPLGLRSSLPASTPQASAEVKCREMDTGVSGKSPSASQAAPGRPRVLSGSISTAALPASPAIPFYLPPPDPH